MAAIGIDLGTTYSRVAVLKDGRIEIITNDHGNRATPSCVAFTDVERLIGDAAMNQIASNPCNTVFDAKRLIGRRFREVMVQGDLKLWTFNVIKDPNHDIPNVEVTFRGQKKQFTAEEISSMVLMKMKEVAEAYIGQKVNDAVIAVPAYFNDSQRQSTKDAATIAGLNVLRLINEPTAVAVTFDHCVARRSENAGKKMVLIFDLGGGTFDASLLSIDDEGSTFEVKAVAGDTHLGGNDFDNNLMSYCIEVFRNKQNMDITGNKKALGRLRAACEKAKRILSSATKTIIELEGLHEAVDFSLEVTRANFEDLNMSVFAKCIKIVDACLAYAKMDKTSVHVVILVGGSTRIPKLQHMIKTFFDGKELCKRINPDEAVAYGAAVTAAMLSGVKSMILKKLVILDVTPLAVVVEEPGKTMSVVIPRNTLLPSKFTYNRSITTRNNHAFLKFTVYQGQHARFRDNYLLGQFSVSGIPHNNRGVSVAEICFEIDANGILTVTSTHVGLTDKTKSLPVADHRDRLSKQEIEKKIKDAKKLKVEDQEYLDYKKKADAFKDIEDCLFTLKKKLEGDYINQEVLKNLKYLYDDTTKWFAENKAATCDKIKARKEYLEFVCTLAFTKSCPCVSPLGNT